MTGTNFTSWYNSAEGTIYFESQKSPQTAEGTYFEISNAARNSYISSAQRPTTQIVAISVNSATQASLSISTVGANTLKSSLAYKTNDIAACLNGGTVSTDTVALIPEPSTLSLNIGKYPFSSTAFMINACMKKLAYYPLRLTDSQLQALTGS
jgi:hypothetical protein